MHQTFHLILSLLLSAPLAAQDVATDSSAGPAPTAPAVDSAPHGREALLEGREVVGGRGRGTGSFQSVGRSELDAVGSLGEALGRLPGVEVRTTGGMGGFTELSLRQCPSQQVRVFVDGIQLRDQGTSSIDLGAILPEGLDRAEVLQGAGAGGDGRPQLRLFTRRSWGQAGGSAAAGSFGERRLAGWWGDDSGRIGLQAWLARSDNDWPIRSDNSTLVEAGYTKTVRLRNNDFEGWGVAGSWRPDARWSVTSRAEGADQGISGLLMDDPKARWNRKSVQVGVDRGAEGEWSVPLSASFRWNSADWRDTGSNLGYMVDRDAKQEGLAGSVATGVSRTAGGWTDGWIKAGWSGEMSGWSTTTPQMVHLVPKASRSIWSVDAGWTGQSPERFVGASVTARGERVDDGRDFGTGALNVLQSMPDSGWNAWTGSVQAQSWLRGARWQIWVGGGFDQRSPDFFELYGDGATTLRNLSLQAERSATAEMGAAWNERWWSARLVPWVGTYGEPIRRQILGASSIARYVNDSGYSSLGVDFDAKASLCGANLRGAASWNRSSVESPYAAYRGNVPAFMPEWRWNVVGTTPSWAGASAWLSLDGTGASWYSALNRSEIPGWTLVGVGLRWEAGRFRVAGQVSNLGDVRFEEFENFPLSGRAFRVRLDVDLGSARNHSTQEKT